MNTYPIRIDEAAELNSRREDGHALLGRWPSALGLVIALLGAGGHDSTHTLATVVAVCALIYVFAAVTGRQVSAWWGLLGSLPLILSERLTGMHETPFLLVGLMAVVLVLVGWARGVWSHPQHVVQLYGLAGFGAVAVAAAWSSGTLAAVLIAVGLLAHVAWDLVHLVRDQVVGRRYAELCAVLDAALALVIVWQVL